MTETEILQKLGLEDADPTLKDRAMQNFMNIVDKRTMGLVQEMMTQEQRKEFESKSGEMSREEGMAWLKENVVDVDKLYKEVEEDYLQEFISNK